jgi:membrane-anchored glycerophosphoryl diester phosphodiesterase (GDPDase)
VYYIEALIYSAKDEQQLAILFKKCAVFISIDKTYYALGQKASNQNELWEKVKESWKTTRRETTKRLLKDINYGRHKT